MNRISAKLLSILAIFLFIAIIPIAVFAVNEDISIVAMTNSESEQEYTIYIKGISTENFKYAFTNNENADPNGMDLSFINSNPDLGGNQAALLDAATYEKLSTEGSEIYMWAKVKNIDGNENFILEKIQLDLNEALTEEDLEQIETLTTRINVEIGESTEKPSNENCVIKIVAEIASTEGSSPLNNLLFIFADSFGIASIISDEIITPRVAKAESHSEISKIEYGVVMQIKETAINREVTGSLSLYTIFKSEEIISIIPARLTETGSPVNNIYNRVKTMVAAALGLYFTPISRNSFSKASERMARCIPLSASI